MNDDDLVLVGRVELQRLQDNDEFLSELHAFGVEGWSCYDDARESMADRNADKMILMEDHHTDV